jgi:hypothetical protein
MTEVKSKPVRKDSAVAVDTGNDLAVRLASMKPGESVDIRQRTQPTIQTKVAADIGPRPEPVFSYGTGKGRVETIHQFVTRPTTPQKGLPGFGVTLDGPSTTTFREGLATDSATRALPSDSAAVSQDRYVAPGSQGALPEPSPFKDFDAGGPKMQSGTTSKERPQPGLHPEDE